MCKGKISVPMANLTEAIIFDDSGQKEIARIGLNGYKSNATNPININPEQRTIWSFKITGGDANSLFDAWYSCRSVTLRNSDEAEAKQVRVAAFPSDEEGFGLIEFL